MLSAVKDFIVAGELTRQNTVDVRELRKQNEELLLVVEKLAFEIQRIRENESHEREKLLLRLDLKAKQERKQLSKKKPK